MNVQAAPSPYTPAGGSNMSTGTLPVPGNPPVLGQQVPGTTGGLPALSGLAVQQNPMAKQLQSMGRGEDSMLVHMTPNEVNSLRGLAQQFGGDLSVNPNTGLPEAGWLGKLLPTILGIAGAAFGIPTWAIGLGVGAGQTVLTGDLGKGLTAGLQAFGGAGLGQAAGIGGSLGNVGQSLGLTQSATGASNALGNLTAKAAADQAAVKAGTLAAEKATSAGFLSKFGAEAGLGAKGLVGKALPMAAGTAVLGGISDATAPELPTYEPEKTKPYVRMAPARREVRYPTQEELQQLGSGEYNYFTPSNPDPVPLNSQQGMGMDYGFADGGAVQGNAGLDALISSYNAQNPGAITASMRPTPFTPPATAKPSATGGEDQYTFNRTPMGPGTGFGGLNFGNLNLGNLSNLFPGPQTGAYTGTGNPAVVPPSPALQDRVDNGTAPNRMEDFSNIGEISQPYTPPRFVQPEAMDIYGGMQSLPAQQPTYNEPAYTEDFSNIGAISQPYTPPSFVQPDFMDIYGGMQSLPTQQPTYSAPAYEPPALPQTDYSSPLYVPYNPPAYNQPVFNIDSPYEDVNSSGGSQFGRYENVDLFARGGGVNMRDGAFVVDARTVSELGNGSSNAGMELLSRMGGKPVRGPGDGVSDSVKARIGGKQEARVARDEVIFQPEAVRRIGKGSAERGTQKLYALMDKAHKARKKAKRGQDTGLRRGLA